MANQNENNLQTTLRAVSKSTPLLEKLISNEIVYDGFEDEISGVSSKLITILIESGIIDYDELQGVIVLEYQTEDFLRYLNGYTRDTNIESIDLQVKQIEKALHDIKQRNSKEESIEKEKKNIIKRLRNIPTILTANYINIRGTSLFAFQAEGNLEIKKKHLKDCKKDIEALVNAIDSCQSTIHKKRRNINKVVNSSMVLDSFFSKLIDIRKSIIETRNDILAYLSKTLSNENLIKKIKTLGSLKQQGLLFERTNINEVFNGFKGIAQKEKIGLLHDYDLCSFHEKLELETKKKNIDIKKHLLTDNSNEEVKAIQREEKTIEFDIVVLEEKYKMFSDQDDKNLVEFLISDEITHSKIAGLVIRFIIDYHELLEIDPVNRIDFNGKSFPTITNMARI